MKEGGWEFKSLVGEGSRGQGGELVALKNFSHSQSATLRIR